MTIENPKVKGFIELIDASIPLELKKFVDDFIKEHGRKPKIEEFYSLYGDGPKDLGFVWYGGPPLSEEELRNKEASISSQIYRKLKTIYSDEEILEMICSVLIDADRDKTPVYVLTIVYLLTNLIEEDPKVFNALCEATVKFKEIIWGELLFGILRKHTRDERDIVKFAVNLLKSKDYRHRGIGDELLYCTAYLFGEKNRNLTVSVLGAYKIAYNYELDEKTKSPYSDEKSRYANQIEYVSKKLG